MTGEFQHCPVCAAKPGSPVLCAACLNNRELIEAYRILTDKLAAIGEVYVYPSQWSCRKMGGKPTIEDYEKIDLSAL